MDLSEPEHWSLTKFLMGRERESKENYVIVSLDKLGSQTCHVTSCFLYLFLGHLKPSFCGVHVTNITIQITSICPVCAYNFFLCSSTISFQFLIFSLI
jgi:hypothetical protein